MFDIFRQNVKEVIKKRGLNYCQLGEMTKLSEATIKSFMCGASDSRRVAEKIADALESKLTYSDGYYMLTN